MRCNLQFFSREVALVSCLLDIQIRASEMDILRKKLKFSCKDEATYEVTQNYYSKFASNPFEQSTRKGFQVFFNDPFCNRPLLTLDFIVIWQIYEQLPRNSGQTALSTSQEPYWLAFKWDSAAFATLENATRRMSAFR